jgi:hypothetical protein
LAGSRGPLPQARSSSCFRKRAAARKKRNIGLTWRSNGVRFATWSSRAGLRAALQMRMRANEKAGAQLRNEGKTNR